MLENFVLFLQEIKRQRTCLQLQKIGDKVRVSPNLTALEDWIDGEVIDVEHNPFVGLVISIKDKAGRIFFGKSQYFAMV